VKLPPEDSTRVFVACEAGVMRDIRRALIQDRSLDKRQVFTHGYWKLGVVNHPDNDRGEDV
jgi:NADPH-dependent ferric siderophore reductase